MTLIEKLQKIDNLKFSFGKSDEYHGTFSSDIKAYSMYNWNRLGISNALSTENKIRGVFQIISSKSGIFVFNISGVNILKALVGFENYQEAFDNNMITEWELWIILQNKDYLKRTIFHNGKVEFKKIKKSISLSWK